MLSAEWKPASPACTFGSITTAGPTGCDCRVEERDGEMTWLIELGQNAGTWRITRMTLRPLY
jgi:hypothetical protein